VGRDANGRLIGGIARLERDGREQLAHSLDHAR
jgi:hypothetical protein